MYVFGGANQVNQISQVENCQLKTVGQLSFRMKKGACTNVANEFLFICFPESDNESTSKYCYEAFEPLATFERARDSTYSHSGTRIGNDRGMKELSIISNCLLF